MGDTVSYMLKAASGQILTAMASNLGKAADYTKSLEIEEDVLLGSRLYPDMLPLIRQVQIAADTPARGAARLARIEMPSFPDTETSFAELRARLIAVNDYVQGIDSAAIDANALVELEIPLGPMTVNWPGRQYLSAFVLPNLHFHAAITHGLLRQAGMKLGKRDFLMAT